MTIDAYALIIIGATVCAAFPTAWLFILSGAMIGDPNYTNRLAYWMVGVGTIALIGITILAANT